MQDKPKTKAKKRRSVKKQVVKSQPSVVGSDAISQLAALLLQQLRGDQTSAPIPTPVEVDEPQMRGEDFGVDVEQQLFPGETSFGDEMDAANFANSIGFGSQNWDSINNPDFREIDNGGPFIRKIREDLLSVQGQMDAKFEMMSNRIRQIEKYIGQQAAHAVSAGRRMR